MSHDVVRDPITGRLLKPLPQTTLWAIAAWATNLAAAALWFALDAPTLGALHCMLPGTLWLVGEAL